jgi:hypothetical protein
MGKQGSLCRHTLEKCHNCEGNHIAFSNRHRKKAYIAKAAWQKWRLFTTAATDVVLGMSIVVHGHISDGTAEERGVHEEGLADAEEKEPNGVLDDSTMAVIATMTATETGNVIETIALATNDWSDSYN